MIMKVDKLRPKMLYRKIRDKGLLRWIPDYIYSKITYRISAGERLNLSDPKTLNDKLYWLKLFNRNPEYTQMVDKFEVREYIKRVIGEEYLIPLYEVWENTSEIDWEKLPNKFVLKSTHDSKGLVICKDKQSLDIPAAEKKLKKSLKRNFYNVTREWPYKNVKPRIIAEKYMEDKNNHELLDYKFFCFNGEVKMILTVSDINSEDNVKRNFYDRHWNLMPLKEGNAPNTEVDIEKPYNFNKMIHIAEKLSKSIPFVRVDLYEIDNKIYFGELTFYPNNGLNQFEPAHYNEIIGGWLTLPDKSIGKQPTL